MLTYTALELTVCFTIDGDILHYAKKKVSVGGKQNTFENYPLFILKYIDLPAYFLSQTRRSCQSTLDLKDLKFKVSG